MVEIDENQHATYDCLCENKHTSCFCVDGRGMVCVAKCKRDEWDDRLACLRSTISYWMTSRTDKTVEVVSLFFTAS